MIQLRRYALDKIQTRFCYHRGQRSRSRSECPNFRFMTLRLTWIHISNLEALCAIVQEKCSGQDSKRLFNHRGQRSRSECPNIDSWHALLHQYAKCGSSRSYNSGGMLHTRFRQGFTIIGVKGQGQGQSDLILVHDTPTCKNVYTYRIWKLYVL